MKKTGQELNSIFSVAEEMVKNNGEDCYFYGVNDDDFIIASFDGCGGSGSKKYENYSGKTGAYIASRAVCGGVETWFKESNKSVELPDYIQKSLSVCKDYADKAGRIMGSLGKAFPTTASIITGNTGKSKDLLSISCFWAGDSRCYMLDDEGLHQLTTDDLDGQDAMSNLTNDGVMTNVINASTPFEIHFKEVVIDHPCILLTATDGCFGYLNSPMEFEHLLIDTLVDSKSIIQWRILLNDRMHQVSGDDYTLCVAACGYKNFENMRSSFNNRKQYITDMYINNSEDVNALWEVYKNDCSKYL